MRTRTRTVRVRAGVPSGSGSCTAWAEARVSACSSSRRFRSTGLAVISLVLLAVFTAVSMSVVSSAFGSMLASRPAHTSLGAVAPALGSASLAFGVWYATAAWSLAPYPF